MIPIRVKVTYGLSRFHCFLKRSFDICVAAVCLVLTGWIILLAYIAASIDTGKNGLFMQWRIGRHGKPFKVLKIRTMRDFQGVVTSVTTAQDPRITPLGHFLRKTKIDELPQLINVLIGQMSFVGPRPDVAGFADQLWGEDRIILSIRPGITGPATLQFCFEEDLLAKQPDPEKYNREVIFPEKVRLNRAYVENYSFRGDMQYILRTVLTVFR
jgi:lipopolysaccharide/colanic/teichoic acid biosynthesis glycosyltransferase